MVITAQNTNQKPGYKQTEVGLIPEFWEVQVLGQLGEFKNGINKGKTEFGHGFPFVNLLDVFGVVKISNNSKFGLVNSTGIERKVYNLKKGDVLFVRSSVKPEGVGLTTLVAEDLQNTVYSGFLIRFREKGWLAFEFKEHCFGQFGFRNRLIANSTVSANTNINQNALKGLQIVFPPSKEEQLAISTVLSDVDSLITSLDKLIAKKRDIKQATMQQLLTGKTRLPGFSEKLRTDYKKTEIGKIPEDWEICSLDDIVTKVGSGITPTGGEKVYKKEGRLFMRSQNVGWGHLLLDDIVFIDEKTHKSFCTTEIKLDDVLLNITGASIGRSAVVDNRLLGGNVNQHVCIIRVDASKFSPYYLNGFLLSATGQKQIESFQAGGNRQGLNFGQIRSFQIPFPSLPEQQAIATVLSDMDAEITTLEQKRDKVRALKQGMMQELLTGKTRLL